MLLLVVWAVIGLGVGTLIFLAGPTMWAWAGGPDARDKVARWYISLAMSAIGDAAIVAREQGGLSLTSISYDPKFQADKAKVDGEVGHLVDDFGVKSHLSNKPFGISLESHPVYISPLIAEYAEAMHQALDEDRLGIQPDGGMRLDLELPKTSQLPILRDAHRFAAGDCRRRWGQVAEEWTKVSQEGFHDRITLGETLMLIMAFGIGAALMFMIDYAGDTGVRSVSITVSTLAVLLAAPAPTSKDRLDKIRMWSVTAMGVAVLCIVLAVIVYFYGLLIAAVFFLTTTMAAVGPWLTIRLMGDALPLGGLVAKGLWIVAQLTAGRGGLVRADTGHYEYHPLREDDDGFFVRLDNGDEVRIDGDEGDLYRFGWRPLAIAEQKSERNLGPYLADEPDIRKKETREVRQEYDVHHPKQYRSDTWLLSTARLKNLARGSAGSELVRSGRVKALEEYGGTRQINPFHTMLIAGVMCILGFVLTWMAVGGIG